MDHDEAAAFIQANRWNDAIQDVRTAIRNLDGQLCGKKGLSSEFAQRVFSSANNTLNMISFTDLHRIASENIDVIKAGQAKEADR